MNPDFDEMTLRDHLEELEGLALSDEPLAANDPWLPVLLHAQAALQILNTAQAVPFGHEDGTSTCTRVVHDPTSDGRNWGRR